MRIEFLECLKAYSGGYFWIPCPNCGRMFGGQEENGETLYSTTVSGLGKMTCTDPVCKEQVRSINKKNGIPYGNYLLEIVIGPKAERKNDES